MYRGALFQKALAYCLSHHNQVFILSAKYGVLSLDETIETYEETLNTFSRRERWEWSQKILRQIQERGISGEFWFYAGSRYTEFLEGQKPLRGLSIGRQLQWFDQHS
jgi:hypothetical protein